MKLGVRGGNSPTGFLGVRGGFSIINAIQNLIWANKQVDDYLEDQKGATTYEAVRPAKIVADGSTYFECENALIPELDDFEIYMYLRIVNDGLVSSFISQYQVSIDGRFQITKESNETIKVRIGSITVTSAILASGEYEVTVSRVGTSVTLTVNDVSTIKTISGGVLQVPTLIMDGQSKMQSGNELIYLNLNDQATYNAQTLINRDGTFKDYLEDISGNGNHAQQFVQPLIPALHDDSLVGSKYNDDGYSIADGSQYIDEALTTAYGVGERISALNTTKCIGWISDGSGGAERASLDFKGRVKFDVDIVDGDVDNGEGYSNWSDLSDANVLVSEDGIELVGDGINFLNARIAKEYFVASTEYLVVINISENTLTLSTNNLLQDTLFSDGDLFFPIGGTLGEYRDTFTTQSVISLSATSFLRNTETGSIKYTIVFYPTSIFPTDPLTDPLPTTGEFVTGNTWKLDPAYNKAVIADVKEHAYDKTDPTEVVSNLLPCEDAVYSDYLFSSVTSGIVAMYEEAQTGQTLADILKKLELYEYAVDSEGVRAVDSEGYYAIAPKSTTTVVE